MKNFEKYYFSKNDKIRDVIQHFKDKFGGRKLILSVDRDGTMEVDENTNIYKNMKLFLISKKIKFNFQYSGKGTIEISEILEIKDAVQYLNEKSESNVYFFKCIFNPVHYEPVQENKLLYQFNCPLCISKYYTSIEFNYSIFQNKEYISEFNTIGWLKNTYINKSLLIDAKNYDIVKDKKRIYDYEELRSVLNNYEEKLYIEVNPKELEKIRTVRMKIKNYKPFVKKIDETSENKESMEEPKIISSETKEIETINDHDVEDEINQLMNIFLNQVEPIDNETTSLNEEDENEMNEDDIFTSKKSKIFGLSTSFIDKYKKDIIGKGATSCVYKFYKYPDQIFALKVLDIDVIKREEDDSLSINYDKMKRFLAEYEVLCQFDDPKIIRAYGICLGDAIHGPSILLEYCPSNLKQKIKNMNDSERIETIFELSESMKNIHNAGIIHRDLKPENILIDENNHIKVSDFGICTFIELDSESLSRTTYVGTMKCMAPEIRNEQKHYTEKVDVYSFGVVVYYILTKGDYPEITFVEVANGKQAKIPESFSKFSTHLIQQCWSFEPINRPSFDEIFENIRTHKNELI